MEASESKSKSTIKVDDLIGNENEILEVEKPIVMIGGSDGSGTRAIVELLRELGTIIISDDPQTFDVHASILKNGWPGFIQRVYSVMDGNSSDTIFSSSSSTSSSNNSISNSNNTSVLLNNYDWPPLPPTQKDEDKDRNEKRRMEKNIANVEAEIITLKQSWDFKYDTIAKPIHQQEYYDRRRTIQQDISPIAATLSNGNGGRHTTFPALAQNVKYAIKAPVSMLVLPVIVSSFRKKQKQELAKQKRRLIGLFEAEFYCGPNK
ncbi:hypothetical protein FRACYDRAFT_248957 [Fragilariopsis cylindrus CCMP1102]|uniref:Rhodanese domain-containing protein n=1 Tax=Fragilariopsis cylindrus CCMP1102 TaxID=635003 RepID=A0A1E7ESZ3_9STRA|nr:hypothetical protein FRACYDRAFT_248957 [Fragilariopsis cylindrus CCMP1102]|eukprot:OEU09081.1 hypothetical protein FRACYDRAFT_248957 [Fragilariopsis cylindrus CCMP1102]